MVPFRKAFEHFIRLENPGGRVMLSAPTLTKEAPMAQPATRVETSEEDQSASSSANKPVDKFVDGPVHVSIWQNTGSKGAFRNASFEIRYKDSQEQWQTGRSYTASNLNTSSGKRRS